MMIRKLLPSVGILRASARTAAPFTALASTNGLNSNVLNTTSNHFTGSQHQQQWRGFSQQPKFPLKLDTDDEENKPLLNVVPKTNTNTRIVSKGNALMLGALPLMPAGLAASATDPLLGPTSIWLLSSCIPIGTVSLGLPGLAAQSFFLSPIPVFKKILKDKSVGSLPLMPYSSMCASGFLWIAYGAVLDLPAIWLPNIPAFALGAAYTAIFYMNCPSDQQGLPGTKNFHAAAVLASIGTVTAIATTMETAVAANALGWLGTGVVIAMFGGPLVAIKTVLKEKSTRALPFAMTVATFVNCSLWTVYGTCVITDFFIWFPNGLGLLSSIIQFGLFAKFGFAKDEE